MRTLIVDDQALFRDMLVKVCELVLGFREVVAVGMGADAVGALETLDFDLVILDIDLPDLDGFAITEKIARDHPRIRVLGLSAFCDDFTIYRVLNSDMHGFVDKSEQTVDSLGTAIHAVSSGKYFFTEVVRRVQHELRANPLAFPKLLTDKEYAILGLIGLGLDNDAIGSRLEISPNTAQWHRKQIMRKLNIHSVAELVVYAADKGFSRLGRTHR